MIITTYDCTVTGLSAEADESGPLGLLPPGWIEISFKRQVPNPRWAAIQALKDAQLDALQRAQPGLTPAQLVHYDLSLGAQFAALEAATPKFLVEEDTVHLSPPENEEEVRRVLRSIRDLLGMAGPEEEDEEEERSEAEAAAKDKPAAKPPQTAA